MSWLNWFGIYPEYKYFVSYTFSMPGASGFGSIEMKLSKGIKTYSDVKLVTNWLNENVKQDGKDISCVVLNYKRIG